MNIISKLKKFMSEILTNITNVVVIVILIAMLFTIPIFQDYNSRNFPKYEIVKCNTYEIQPGDTLSEIAEKFKPEHMKLSNYIVEIQFVNGISREINAGNQLLIPVEEIR